jgi:hypothetical protein
MRRWVENAGVKRVKHAKQGDTTVVGGLVVLICSPL